MSVLGELKRRKIIQVIAVYAVVAWLVVQVITSIEHPLNLPAWTDTLVIVLLALGFPVMLVLSWAFNVTPSVSFEMEAMRKPAKAQEGPSNSF